MLLKSPIPSSSSSVGGFRALPAPGVVLLLLRSTSGGLPEEVVQVVMGEGTVAVVANVVLILRVLLAAILEAIYQVTSRRMGRGTALAAATLVTTTSGRAA